MNNKYELLIEVLRVCNNRNQAAILLQSFIQEYGAIPDEYGDVIKKVISILPEKEMHGKEN